MDARSTLALKPLAVVIALANAQLASALVLECPEQIDVNSLITGDTAETTTLQEALQTALNCGTESVVTINIADDLAGETEELSVGALSLDASKSLTVNGPSNGEFTITTSVADQVIMSINEPAVLAVNDVTFAGIDGVTRSASLFNVQGGQVSFSGVGFRDIVGTAAYSALYISSPADVVIADVTASGNSSTSGVIGGYGNSVPGDTTVSVSDSVFTNNSATTSRGGAINAFDMDLTIEDSVFDSNTATGDNSYSGGGAIYMGGETGIARIRVSDSTFRLNQARNYGGAIYQSTGDTLTIEDTVFEDNSVVAASNEFGTGASAEAHGGAITSDRSTDVTIARTSFTGNDAKSYGGAVYVGRSGRNGTVSIEDSTFANNSASVSVSESTLANGGAIYTDAVESDAYQLNIRRSTFNGNNAEGSAGALYASGAGVGLLIENSTFDANSASEHSGGLYLGALPGASISHVTATSNSVESDANVASGFIYASAPTDHIEISHSVFLGNTTGNDDAGNICVSSEYSFDAQLSYSFWNGVNNDAVGCRTPVTDQTVISSVSDPLLGSLQDNGGDTLTRYPALNSVLVDAGDANIQEAPDTDQRGSVRVSRGAIDIGAVEYGNLPPEVSAGEAVTVESGESISISLSDWFTDPENDSLSFIAEGAPSWLTLDSTTGEVTGIAGAAGSYDIEVTAQDEFGLTTSVTVSVVVSGNTDSSSSSSGGAMSTWLLMLLGSLRLMRRRG